MSAARSCGCSSSSPSADTNAATVIVRSSPASRSRTSRWAPPKQRNRPNPRPSRSPRHARPPRRRQRMAHKKGLGSSRNGRESNAQRLGVKTFKGIPYGQDTSGENRWLPAKPPKPWDGEYPALIYGANCPQHLHDFTAIQQSFRQDWDDGYMSEDMLKLNVWTSSLTGKRPVMVYFHGGGFSFGSSYELVSHEGAQMARHHDVVQVSVNHRLNILGFFEVSEIGGRCAP